MATYNLTKAACEMFHLTLSLLISLFALPFVGALRIILLFVFLIEKLLQALFIPAIAIYFPARSFFLLSWQRFLKLSATAPVVKYRVRIICCALLAIETGLAWTIFVKSSLLFLPWLLQSTHLHRTRDDVLLHMALFVATCAPLMSVFGAGTACCYYLRKYSKYGKYEKRMRRKPGGRGYWKDPTDGEDKARARAAAKWSLKTTLGKQGSAQVGSTNKANTAGWDEAKLYGARAGRARGKSQGDNKRGMREEPDVVQRPEPVATLPKPAVPWESNKFTKKGVAEIWVDRVKGQFESGYDGRATRQRLWNEDMEMMERKQVHDGLG